MNTSSEPGHLNYVVCKQAIMTQKLIRPLTPNTESDAQTMINERLYRLCRKRPLIAYLCEICFISPSYMSVRDTCLEFLQIQLVCYAAPQ